MNEIKRQRFNDELQRLFGMDVITPCGSLTPEIQPGFDINQGSSGLELPFLRGERLAIGGNAAGAGVGTTSYCGFANPTGSGMLLVTTSIEIGNANATGTEFTLVRNTNFATDSDSSGAQYRDFRMIVGVGAVPRPVAQMRASSDSVNVGTTSSLFWRQFIPPLSPYVLPFNFVLPPGTSFIVQPNGTNLAVRLCVSWMERSMPDLEGIQP